MGFITSPSLFHTGDLQFPEGPRWRDGRLWVSDALGQRVVAISPDGHVEEIASVAGHPSGLGFLPDGTLLIVSVSERCVLRLDPHGLRRHADLSGLLGTGYPNDMVVDAQGRAYVGNFGCDPFAGEDPAPTNLLLVTADGGVREVATDLLSPNGMAITPDGSTLIVAETYRHRLTAMSIAQDGSLSGRRVFAQFREERTPDGITLDADGHVWVASAFTGEYLLVADGGEVLEQITVDAVATACMLGGEDGRTLFLLQARTTPEEFREGRSTGLIEAVRVTAAHAGQP